MRREESAAPSRASSAIDRELQRPPLPRSRLAFVGFSQGAMLALDLGPPWPHRLPESSPSGLVDGTPSPSPAPALIVHGTSDASHPRSGGPVPSRARPAACAHRVTDPPWRRPHHRPQAMASPGPSSMAMATSDQPDPKRTSRPSRQPVSGCRFHRCRTPRRCSTSTGATATTLPRGPFLGRRLDTIEAWQERLLTDRQRPAEALPSTGDFAPRTTATARCSDALPHRIERDPLERASLGASVDRGQQVWAWCRRRSRRRPTTLPMCSSSASSRRPRARRISRSAATLRRPAFPTATPGPPPRRRTLTRHVIAQYDLRPLRRS
nr:hypothetical protein [Deltaproteobacteria bacterium]